jgi:glutaconate CoA-transferase subunit A
MTPDVVYDQLIGAGLRRKLVFSWGGNPGVGSLHRFRDAVENGWPRPLETRGAQPRGHGQPLRGRRVRAAVRRAARLPRHRPARPTDTIKPITCPFTGEELTAVPPSTRTSP